MKLKIRPAARQDLLRAARFYEAQEEGVGSYFLDTLYSEIDSLMLFGGIHPVHFGRYHRLLSRKFPFAVYYRIEKGVAIVSAVLDCRSNPEKVKRRLS